MPYIPTLRRKAYTEELDKILSKLTDEKGDLTYLLYYLALKSIKKKSYTNISNAISCLNDAAEELRRRHLNPYEDKKIDLYGDV